MHVEKPHLNSDLRITDLVDMLHVNRTYISSFINREYGLNFSGFINKYRIEEYNALKENPAYSKISKLELAEMAGFNSYRSFQRTEKYFSGRKK
jgi:YesN/AraC family two-component response regulator